MVKVEAMIRPQKLDAVLEAVHEHSLTGMTVTEVKGMGRQRGVTYTYRGSQYTTPLSHKVKIELVVRDEQVEEVVKMIQDAAGTGEVGDGKIFLIPVADAFRIRNGERGDVALS